MKASPRLPVCHKQGNSFMSYKLNANLVPFLSKRADGVLTARLVSADKKSGVLELNEGVQVTVPLKELGVKLDKSTGATLEFNATGVLDKHTLDTPPAETKTATSTRGGAARKRQISQF